MSENSEASRTRNDADRSPERIDDPKAGLARLRNALKRILKVSKDDIGDARAHQ